MNLLYEINILDPDFPFMFWEARLIEYCPHWHEGMEFVYVRVGTVKVGLNDVLYTLKKGDLLIIHSGDIHYFITDDPNCEFIVFQFSQKLLGEQHDVLTFRKLKRPLIRPTTEVTYCHLIEIIDKIKIEFKQKEYNYQLMLKALIYEFMVQLSRNYEMMNFNFVNQRKQMKALSQLGIVFRYINDNYASDIDIDVLSRMVNYSKFHFVRFFKEATGITVGNYVRNYRVKKATTLLLETDKSIIEVSYLSGFKSVKTFNRVFKNSEGCSPSNYRSQNMRTVKQELT